MMQAQAAKRWTSDQLSVKIQKHTNHIKVLLPAGEDFCEGAWVLVLDGDDEQGFGMLATQPLTRDPALPSLHDFVQYETVNPDHKPYITAWGRPGGSG